MAKRILVADDSTTMQRAFAMVFAGSEFTLVSARSVDEAVSAARHGRPDLVIADVVLGNSNGYDLCATLKADPGLRNVPVVILASNQNPYDETRAHRVGAAGALSKPFDSQALTEQLTSYLARSEGKSAASISAAVQPSVVRDLTERVESSEPADDEDDYGEFTIERPSGGSAAAPMPARPVVAPPRPAPVAPVAAPPPRPAPAPAPSALRPSLIPGVRPAAPVPPRQPLAPAADRAPAPPAAAPPERAPLFPPPSLDRAPAPPPPERQPPPAAERPSFPSPLAPPPSLAPSPARSPATRTMTGLPAVAPPVQARTTSISSPMPRAPSASVPLMGPSVVPPPAAPSGHHPPVPTAPFPLVAPPAVSAAVSQAVSNTVAQKVAALAARGPEYEAIAKLSREIIEQVVWEVVPELAEVIIRQEIDRLAAGKR